MSYTLDLGFILTCTGLIGVALVILGLLCLTALAHCCGTYSYAAAAVLMLAGAFFLAVAAGTITIAGWPISIEPIRF